MAVPLSCWKLHNKPTLVQFLDGCRVTFCGATLVYRSSVLSRAADRNSNGVVCSA